MTYTALINYITNYYYNINVAKMQLSWSMRNCRFRLGSREHFTDVGTLRKLLNLAITIIADGHTLIVRQIYCPFDLQPIGTCYTNTKTPTNTTADGRYIQHPMTCDARVNVLAFQVRSILHSHLI